MALRVQTAKYKGKEARDKNKGTLLKNLSHKKEGNNIKKVYSFPTLDLYYDDTLKNVKIYEDGNMTAFGEVFAGLQIDSNYRILFKNDEIERYSDCINGLLMSRVRFNGRRFKLAREEGDMIIPIFERVDIGDKFSAYLNSMLSVEVIDEKLVLKVRKKNKTKYSIRLANYLKSNWKSGKVEMKLRNLLNEIKAPVTYGKSYAEFDKKVMKDAQQIINMNDMGLEILDYGKVLVKGDVVIWLEIKVDSDAESK